MSRRLIAFVVRRTIAAVLLVVLAASASLLLARLAPGDHLAAFDIDPARAAEERARLGLDRPVVSQYLAWLGALARLDLGESAKYPGRSVASLIGERAGNSALLGASALLLATVLGIPLGVLTGSRRGPAAGGVRAGALLLLSTPPVVLSLAFLFLASRTGWFAVGGLPDGLGPAETLRHLTLPALAVGLPLAAVIERVQSRAVALALRDPAILAARARGLSRRRVLWRHAFRLSLHPVLAIYGIVVGTMMSGSFVVEYVMAWPGLATLMYDALVFRDANLVAGCAATGAAFLAAGVLGADLALAAADPRLGEPS